MRRLAFLAPLLAVLACSHGGMATTSSGSGAGGSTTATTSGNGGAGSTSVSSASGFTTASATSGSSSSSSSTGSAMAAAAPGMDLVSGGLTCKSSHYSMVMTLGQPTQNQSITTSPSYKMHGGLIGTTN